MNEGTIWNLRNHVKLGNEVMLDKMRCHKWTLSVKIGLSCMVLIHVIHSHLFLMKLRIHNTFDMCCYKSIA